MTRIASPFAASGDKEQIPQTKQDTGEISFSEGYGPDYEKDLDNDTGAKTIERAKLNWLLCLVTSEIKKYQEQGIPDYISKEDNGGIDYPYAAAAMVRYNNKIYYSLKDENTDKPDTNSWSLLDPSEYLSVGGGTINGDLTITGSLDINGEQPYTKSNPPPATPNSLSIGTVTTLEPGAPATAEITGEAPEQTLSLGIPAGAPGASGSSSVEISSNGYTYKPNDSGVITLGSAAGMNITHDDDDYGGFSRDQSPDWVPSGALAPVASFNLRSKKIDWKTFRFIPGCSYSISKQSTNDPLASKAKNTMGGWVVSCLSCADGEGNPDETFLIAREAGCDNNVYMLYSYNPSSGNKSWMVGTVAIESA
ncbi:hypothetical protein ACSD30_000712 [Escherichia coli]|nr:hypothetical protein [Escherichia coli]EJG8081899.1 hypothetical protein [Escherichia coli]ELO1960191.1 hypothetical protein [Escherichia coli]ELO3079096.1 hypothetical protein [Escherichia coli]ELO3209584.1 hypothetical protein [Escherichia coli]